MAEIGKALIFPTLQLLSFIILLNVSPAWEHLEGLPLPLFTLKVLPCNSRKKMIRIVAVPDTHPQGFD